MRLLKLYLLLLSLLFFAKEAFALPFIITPISIPPYVPVGGSANATFNVTNNTGSFHSNIVVRDLPPGVSVNTTTGCGASFSLAAGASCILTLILTEPVINGFFFVCLNCGDTCAGAALNVPGGPAVYVYLTNSAANIIRCIMDPGSGSFNTCVTAATIAGTPQLKGIKISPDKTRVYAADFGNNNVQTCVINTSTGLLSGCTGTGSFPANSGPFGLAFGPGGTRIYVALNGVVGGSPNGVYTCSVNTTTGLLSGCASAGGGNIYNAPTDLGINTAGSIVWVTQQSAQDRYCSVSSGTFSSCTATGPAASSVSITLNPAFSYAYIGMGTGTVQKCNVLAVSGAFSSCATALSPGSSVTGVLVNAANTYFYYVTTSGAASYCSISTGTGALSNCTTINNVGAYALAIRE